MELAVFAGPALPVDEAGRRALPENVRQDLRAGQRLRRGSRGAVSGVFAILKKTIKLYAWLLGVTPYDYESRPE